MTRIIGLIGSILLALCGLPQAIQSIRTKSSDGISTLFLAMWGVGEVFILAYILLTTLDLILILNYSFNIVLVAIIAFYKVRRRERM
jgi:uncharacterized protein with PQ loop repeat